MLNHSVFWRYFIVPVFLSLVILIISLIPMVQLPEIKFIASDKLGHLIAFGLLMYSYLWAFEKQTNFYSRVSFYIIFSFLLTAGIGGGIELLQHYLPINRFGDYFDFYFDIAGIILALILFIMIKKRIIISLVLLLLVSNISFSQEKESSQDFQNTLNAEYMNPEESPLDSADLIHFTGLEFFPIENKFIVSAKIERDQALTFFEMETTTDRRPEYRIWAHATFTMDGKNFKLTIYQNKKLMNTLEYGDYLFLPFTDLSNDKTSYSGGRYIDLRMTDNDEIIIDFNKAYNPYCAYSDRWSCPIVPSDNNLDVEINAGVKKYH